MDHNTNNNVEPQIKNEIFKIHDAAEVKKDTNPVRKCSTVKMEYTFNNTANNISSSSAFEAYTTQFANNMPPNAVGNSSQNFVPYFGFMTNDQYRSLMRLVHLFPQLHAITLKGVLEVCNYDTIQTIDSILYALQYRKYLEAKCQGFPLDYSVHGPQIYLLPSFLSNRSTNPNVYNQLFQDNASFNNVPNNPNGNLNNFLHHNYGASSPTVTDTTSSNTNHPAPQCFSSNQVSNENSIEHNVQMSRNCLPPFDNLVQCTSSYQNNEKSIKQKMDNCVPFFTVTSSSSEENIADNSVINLNSVSISNTERQSTVIQNKKTNKTVKVKRLIKVNQSISRAKSLEKKSINLPKSSASKNKKEFKILKNLENEETSPIETTPTIINLNKKLQCPLGDRDCNQIFQN